MCDYEMEALNRILNRNVEQHIETSLRFYSRPLGLLPKTLVLYDLQIDVLRLNKMGYKRYNRLENDDPYGAI